MVLRPRAFRPRLLCLKDEVIVWPFGSVGEGVRGGGSKTTKPNDVPWQTEEEQGVRGMAVSWERCWAGSNPPRGYLVCLGPLPYILNKSVDEDGVETNRVARRVDGWMGGWS